jgi:hypothetical protein
MQISCRCICKVPISGQIYRIPSTPHHFRMHEFLLLEQDFADNTSATAALTSYESNRGGRGGCLGFFVH